MKFALSSFSNDLLFWSVNQKAIYENSELNVFKKIEFIPEIFNKLPNVSFGTNIYKTLESCW